MGQYRTLVGIWTSWKHMFNIELSLEETSPSTKQWYVLEHEDLIDGTFWTWLWNFSKLKARAFLPFPYLFYSCVIPQRHILRHTYPQIPKLLFFYLLLLTVQLHEEISLRLWFSNFGLHLEIFAKVARPQFQSFWFTALDWGYRVLPFSQIPLTLLSRDPTMRTTTSEEFSSNCALAMGVIAQEDSHSNLNRHAKRLSLPSDNQLHTT